MLESGSSGSVRGVLSNEHPYPEPRPSADLHGLSGDCASAQLGEITNHSFFRQSGLAPAINKNC
jgi:hypothetical protein